MGGRRGSGPTCSMQRFGGGSEVNLLTAPPLSHLCHCHMTFFVSIEHVACSPAPSPREHPYPWRLGPWTPRIPLLTLISTSLPVYLQLQASPGAPSSTSLAQPPTPTSQSSPPAPLSPQVAAPAEHRGRVISRVCSPTPASWTRPHTQGRPLPTPGQSLAPTGGLPPWHALLQAPCAEGSLTPP